MTVAEFCEDRNISWHAYYYWLRKIREYITQPQSTEAEFVQLPSPMEISAPTDSGSIIIHVGEITVDVKVSVSRTSLKNVLKVLQDWKNSELNMSKKLLRWSCVISRK